MNERVRAPGWRVASMASSCGWPPCSPHWLLEDTPKKHTRQVNAGCSPCRRSCGYVLAPVPVRGATSKPLCNPADPGASEPQSTHRRAAAAATATQGARRGESPGLAPVPFLPAPGRGSRWPAPPPGSDGGPGALRPALFNQRSSRGLKSSLWRLQISPAARERSYLHMISK